MVLRPPAKLPFRDEVTLVLSAQASCGGGSAQVETAVRLNVDDFWPEAVG